jgi:hypothetical protein
MEASTEALEGDFYDGEGEVYQRLWRRGLRETTEDESGKSN